MNDEPGNVTVYVVFEKSEKALCFISDLVDVCGKGGREWCCVDHRLANRTKKKMFYSSRT